MTENLPTSPPPASISYCRQLLILRDEIPLNPRSPHWDVYAHHDSHSVFLQPKSSPRVASYLLSHLLVIKQMSDLFSSAIYTGLPLSQYLVQRVARINWHRVPCGSPPKALQVQLLLEEPAVRATLNCESLVVHKGTN